jgi:hypothetical protein
VAAYNSGAVSPRTMDSTCKQLVPGNSLLLLLSYYLWLIRCDLHAQLQFHMALSRQQCVHRQWQQHCTTHYEPSASRSRLALCRCAPCAMLLVVHSAAPQGGACKEHPRSEVMLLRAAVSQSYPGVGALCEHVDAAVGAAGYHRHARPR